MAIRLDPVGGYEDLKQYLGQTLEVVCYGDLEDPDNIAIECEATQEVILDFDKPEETETQQEAPVPPKIRILKEVESELDVIQYYERGQLISWKQLRDFLNSLPEDSEALDSPISVYLKTVDEHVDVYAIAKESEDSVLSEGELCLCIDY